ncbi:MAG: hypothetical protein K6G63_00100 [Eubacterium sp.]|nr:hypothetical protein [Eubacterium sp.]
MRYIVGLLILVISLLLDLTRIDVGNEFLCGADVLRNQLGSFSFLWAVIVPLIIVHQKVIEKSFKYQYIIRSNSWWAILKRQLLVLGITSAVISLTYIVFVIVYCKVNGIVLYNWNIYDSMFCLITQKQLNVDGFVIYAYAFLCIFLRCFLINNILLIFNWTFENGILGILIVLAAVFCEAILGIKIICRVFVFNYDIWYKAGERMASVIQSIIYVVIILMTYKYLLSRKEKKQID